MQEENLISERVTSIADAWYQALADSGNISQAPELIRHGLHTLTKEITTLACDKNYQSETARVIGSRLSILGFKNIQTVGVVHPILIHHLSQGLEQKQLEAIHTRLGNMLIDLTVGFLEQQRHEIMVEREKALQAYESEWKHFIADRQEMEQKSQAILRALPDTLAITTLDGIVLYYHSGTERRFPNEGELPFKNIRSYLPAQVADELLDIYRDVINTGRARTHEYSVVYGNEGKRDFQDNITPYTRNSVLVISREVTRQKHIEEELRTSEARFRSVIEDQTELIVRWKPDSTLTFVNEATCRFAGLATEKLIGQPFFLIVLTDEQPETGIFISSALTLTPENPIAKGQSLVKLNHLEPRWVQWTNRALFNEDQQIIEFQTVGRDITDLRRFEDELRESEARYRNVVETQSEIIGRFSLDGTITFVNEAAHRLFGISTRDIVGHNIMEFVSGIDLLENQEALLSASQMTPDNNSRKRELGVTLPSGNKLQVEAITQAIFNDQEEIIEFQATVRDITDFKRMEAALRKSEARHRSVVEGQTEFIIRYLPDSTITFVNDALCRFFSQTRQELLGGSAINLVYGADKSFVVEGLAKIDSIPPDNPIQTGQTRVILANGEIRWVEWTNRVIFDTDGTVTECQSVGRDITPLKQAQETLEQQNELLRQLGDQLINIQEIERQRIARDLHDSVLNELGAMLISAPEMVTPKVVRDNYEKLIEQLRQTINGLRTPMLNYGLHAALEDLFDRIMDNLQDDCALTMEVPPSLARYDTNVELHLFRIIQQACENSVQHAQAKNIRIHGKLDESRVDITVEDDGIGFLLDPDPDLTHVLAQKHFGLVSMLERGQLIGANVLLSSQPGAGTQVQVYWASKED